MKKSVKILVGLPASGKTFFAKEISIKENRVLIDDPVSILSALKKITESNETGFVITHPAFCDNMELSFLTQDLKFLAIDFEIFYFENNKMQCLKNDKHRGSLSQIDIDYFSSIYIPPMNVKLIPVATFTEGVKYENSSLQSDDQ